VLVGDVTGRIVYGSPVVYGDLDGGGALELRRAQRPTSPGFDHEEDHEDTNPRRANSSAFCD
jgi:hypothetical protein